MVVHTEAIIREQRRKFGKNDPIGMVVLIIIGTFALALLLGVFSDMRLKWLHPPLICATFLPSAMHSEVKSGRTSSDSLREPPSPQREEGIQLVNAATEEVCGP